VVAGAPAARRTRLLVLGAGAAQLGLLEAARRRGDLEVIAVDRDPGAVGFGFAEKRAVVSTEDEAAVERLARSERVAGIVSPGADWPVGVAARIAERMGLPHPIDAQTATLATTKSRQRERFAAAGVEQPRVFGAGEAPSIPCVVKAPDRQGQRGLTLVRDPAELAAAVAAAVAESRSGSYLAEELIDGPEVTVNAFSVDGEFVPLAVTDRLTAEPPAFGVALAHVWPSVHDASAAAEAARRAAEALGIRNGPTYTQVRLGPDGPRVIELAARLGGGHDAELVEAVTGVDLNGLTIAVALGEDPSSMTIPTAGTGQPASAVVSFLVPPEGVLRAVHDVAGAEAVEDVLWVRVYLRPGWRFGPLLRGADRAGAILAVGDERSAALARARRAAEAVRFEVDADAP
jgi:biotin carboxylase